MKTTSLSLNTVRKLAPCLNVRTLTSSARATEDFNYIEKNKIPTDYYQSKIPNLPIPQLEDSCRRYLAALRPIIQDDCKYEKTVDIVRSFSIGIGQQLHNKLLDHNKNLKHTSYYADDWLDSYLSSRAPLPLNFNPFLILQDDPDFRYNDPCTKATNFLISCLRYRRSLLENVLAPVYDQAKNKDSNITPYDMSQFSYLFESTRIPFVDIDVLQNFQLSRHIVVLKNGNFYSFDVLDEHQNILPPHQIGSCIKHIWNIPHTESPSISWLTCLPRDEWARLRAHLTETPTNSSNLSLIDSALTVLCLEPDIDSDECPEKERVTFLGKNFLHGCPPSRANNFLNRWFDKSFSTIFTANGAAAINFEHSWADGFTLTRFYSRVFEDFTTHHFIGPDDIESKTTPPVHKIEFQIDDILKSAIEEAREKHLTITGDLDLNFVTHEGLTKSFLKDKKISPDSFFQLAFQMAFFKISQGLTPSTYESCSTAAFKHGRTETIRSATCLTSKVCKMFHIEKENYTIGQMRNAINECSLHHSNLAKEAAKGQGFDRHFFALKNTAGRQGMEDVSLFKDSNYTFANNFTLSTSSLFADKLIGGGFGPVINDGFGLAYGYNQDNLCVYASNYASQRDGIEFAEALKISMGEIVKILRET